MNKHMTPAEIILRDAAGVFYLLRPPMLAQAKATPEQQAELKGRMADDTQGFAQLVIDIGAILFPGKQIATVAGIQGTGGVRRVVADEATPPSAQLVRRPI